MQVGIDAGSFPPLCFVAEAVDFAMVSTAQRHRVFVARLARQRPRLREAKVMGVGRLASTDQARLLGDKSDMEFIPHAARFR